MGVKRSKPIRVGEGLYEYTTATGLIRYKASLKHLGQYHRKFGFPTISKARQWRQSRLGCIADGRLFPEQEQKREREKQQEEKRLRQEAEAAQVLTLKGYSDTWMKAKQAMGLKYTTLKRYQSILNIHLNPAFGSLPLKAVDRAKVRELVGTLNDQPLKPKSIKNVLLCLSALYTDAIEDGHVQHNPALKPGKLIKTTKRSEQVLPFTHEEEWRVLETAKEHYPHHYPFILLLFRTGLRVGEAVALRPEDLDLRKRSVWVQRNFTAGQLSNSPKSRQKRKVDLAEDLVAIFKDYLVIQEAEALLPGRSQDEWLFTTPQGAMIDAIIFVIGCGNRC
jgi:integrase